MPACLAQSIAYWTAAAADADSAGVMPVTWSRRAAAIFRAGTCSGESAAPALPERRPPPGCQGDFPAEVADHPGFRAAVAEAVQRLLSEVP